MYSNIIITVTTLVLLIVSAPVNGAPTAPTNLAVVYTGNIILLNWATSTDSASTITEYDIFRCQGPSCSNFTQIGMIPDSGSGTGKIGTNDPLGVSLGNTYRYEVQAKDAAGLISGFSNVASITLNFPPTNLTIISSANNKITLTWTASVSDAGAAGYSVERCQGFGCSTFTQIGTSASYPYVDTTSSSLVPANYRVRATDVAGNLSDPSNIVSTGLSSFMELNIGGSSAATPFLNQIMPAMFDPVQPITHYVNGSISSPNIIVGPTISAGNLSIWTGVFLPSVSGNTGPGLIRVAATSSLDAYARLECQNPNSFSFLGGYYSPTGFCATAPAFSPIPIGDLSGDANVYYLDFTNPSGCGTPVTKVANTVSGSVQYTEISGCTGIVKLPVYLGVSDTGPTSFNQVGPTFTYVRSLNSGSLTMMPEAIVPYQIVVGSQVTYANSVTPNLTRDQVTFLLNRPVTNWNLLPGYTSVNAQPYLCLAQAGSGVKALLQLRITLPFHEYTALGSTPYVSFGGTINDVMNCISTHPYSIGYIPADQVPNLTAGKGVTLDGLAPYEANAANPRRNVQNGFYDFWGVESFVYRTVGDPSIGTNQTNLMNAIMNYANNPAIYPYIPAGKYWVPYSQMCVTRANSDTGYNIPLTSTSNSPPTACPIP